jgi:adenylate kinase family enzyme
MAIMQRITICGNSGAGKSTFAEELSSVSGLPVFHLDMLQFQPGWEKTPEPEFNKIHEDWLAKPCWIIEGVGDWKPLKKRFEAADTIIYLDFPVDYCLQKAKERTEKDKISPNPFLPPDSPYAAKADKQEEVIRFFQKEWRPKILQLMEILQEGRNLFVFTKPEALEDFLNDANVFSTFTFRNL